MENQSASQCADCLAVYDGPEADCPACQAADGGAGPRRIPFDAEESDMNISTRQEQTAPPPAAHEAASTLIEFPVAGRTPRPQWRKELS